MLLQNNEERMPSRRYLIGKMNNCSVVFINQHIALKGFHLGILILRLIAICYSTIGEHNA